MTDKNTQNNNTDSKSGGNSQRGWLQNMVREHSALLLSGLYFVASLIGLVFSWDFLRFFNINVFRYAEISDFLLASLKEPYTWLLAVAAVALVLLDNALSRRVEARGPGPLWRWYGNARYRQLNFLLMVVFVGAFLHGYAVLKERDIRSGESAYVTVRLADGEDPQQLVLLGTTGRFVFFYDHLPEQVFIHPHESILTISKSSPNRHK